jgi:PAS domain S-box-containing protein
VAAAIKSVPGIGDYRCFPAPSERPDGSADEGEADGHGANYEIDLHTARKSYGRIVLVLEDRAAFDQYEAAVHNFCNSVTMHLENLEYRSRLEEQVRAQTAELELNRAFLESLFDQSSDYISVIDLDYTIVRVNPAAVALARPTGSEKPTEPSDLEGRACYEAYFERSTPCENCPAREAMRTKETHSATFSSPGAGNDRLWFDVSASPVVDGTGNLMYIKEVGRDISALKRLEEKYRQTAEEKELLLREIHHRVKNNLNMATSLLRLQFAGFDDDRVRRAVNASVDRIQSMSLVHRFFYQSEVSDIAINIDTAVPVGLIINELVTNALKYAFPDDATGTISVRTALPSSDRIRLTVEDDGVGLPASFSMKHTGSLGMQLVSGLAAQINGEVSVSSRGAAVGETGTGGAETSAGRGAAFTITFPLD